MNYEKDLSIDPDALDIEFLSQPSTYFKYAKESAQAKDTYSRAKENLETVRAEQDQTIRQDPTKYGFTAEKKPTEASINAAILQTAAYKAANEAYIKAKYEADLIQAAVMAIDQKKSSLEHLSRLTIAGYCAMPSEPRDLAGEWKSRLENRKEERSADTQRTIKDALNKGRKEVEPAPIEVREVEEPRRRRREA